uniref:Uncharacterized protein n=1 Tax=Tanacetum cinerariifolium TaxID=118510 RepID=A0A699L0T9_TANCI|nr:hypothetical protein [Tanacetum cinerariifolium]
MGCALAHIRFEGALIWSIDLPFSTGGHIPGSDEGSMTLKELTNLCTTLLQKRKNLKSQQMFQDINDVLDKGADTKMIVEDKGNGEKGGSTTETVSTARPDISAARPEVKLVLLNQKLLLQHQICLMMKMSPLLIPW